MLVDATQMRALSIRQPYAELILRGIKPIEFRTRPTRIIGQRFHIYASKQWAAGKLFLEGCRVNDECRNSNDETKIWGDNVEVPGGGPAPWMVELARMLILKDLPTGVIVGSAVIERVTQMKGTAAGPGLYQWHLADVRRTKRLRQPTGHPQPVWFEPNHKPG
jgi:hypothetical protein